MMGCFCLMVSATRVPKSTSQGKRFREVEPAGAEMLNGYDESNLHSAILTLKRGGIVALPTETVYGLAADARSEEAVNKIFAAKDRPADHPLIVHIESFAQVAEWAVDVHPIAEKIAAEFWPGPLTMLFKKAPHVLDVITGGKPTICLRVPNHPVFLQVLHAMKTGLAAPSANPYQRLSPTCAKHVMFGLGDKIDAIVDGGKCKRGIESTIIDLTGLDTEHGFGMVGCAGCGGAGERLRVRILRKGPITKAMLEAKNPELVVEEPEEHDEKVSGNMLQHYQPLTPASLMSLESIVRHMTENVGKKFAVVYYSSIGWVSNSAAFLPQLPDNKDGYESELYASLFEADQLGVDEILIERPPADPDWSASLDRLRKATAKTPSRRKESIDYY